MGRVVLELVAAICLIALVFTDLDLTQRLLLIGISTPGAILIWQERLNGKA